MITSLEVYLILLADSINNTLSIIFMLALTIVFLLLIGIFVLKMNIDTFSQKDERERSQATVAKCIKAIKISTIIGLITLIIVTFTPDTKTLIAMYIVPKIVNSKVVNNIPDYLQEYIKKNLN